MPFLGEVPIDADIRIKGDDGQHRRLCSPRRAPSANHLLRICERTAIEIAKQLLETPAMPTLELL